VRIQPIQEGMRKHPTDEQMYRRVLFYAKKITGHDVESFPYTLIS
jgi:hypothetical protein